MTVQNPNPLRERWDELLRSDPKLRIRDAARQLACSEAELLATKLGDGVTRLDGDWGALIREMPRLGEVMCLTRNEAAVHERYGAFTDQIHLGPHAGTVLGPDIDLRLFLGQWRSGFACTDETRDGLRRSFHFFDRHGSAVHKIYLTESSPVEVFDELSESFAGGDASITVDPAAPRQPAKPDWEIDIPGFRNAWLEAKDTHDFFVILKNFGLAREQALRLAPEDRASPLPTSAVESILQGASKAELPIMVFVASPGCIQIHTGPVKRIQWFGNEWLNVLDEKFNLHLRMSLIPRAWHVRKDTADGIVTSIELFDNDGENVALLFGKRKPGQPEDPAWRALAASALQPSSK